MPPYLARLGNWGYISFFGCIAALITLLFFAIGQVKQADEARLSQAGRSSSDNEAIGQRTGSASVVEGSLYKNAEAGFTLDVSPFIEASDGANPIVRLSNVEAGYDWVAVLDSSDCVNPGYNCKRTVSIVWNADLRDTTEYIAAQRDKFRNDIGVTNYLLTTSSVNGLLVMKEQSIGGYCDGANSYSFFHGGHLVTISENCGYESSPELSATIATLRPAQ